MIYYGKLKFLPCGSITAEGWLREQLLRSKNGMGGHLDELEPGMMIDPYIKKKTTAAWGKVAAGWGAEISGNYWYGLIALAFTLPDKQLQEKAEEWVNAVLAVQEEDGYLGAYSKEDDRSEDYNAWGNACGMRALLLYAQATGRQDVFDAVHRGLLWFCRTKEWKFTAYAGEFILNLMSYCYIHTADKELLDFCKKYEEFLDNTANDTYRKGISAMADDYLFYNQCHAAGYAVGVRRTAAEYLCNGEERLLNASKKAIEKLHKKCLMVNGGISGDAEWLSPKGATGETEYCTSTFLSASYAVMAAATGEAIWGDYIEKVIFNVAQGARKKDERAITYFTAPNQLIASDHSSKVHDPHCMYAPVHSTSCCSVNSVAIMPEFVKNMAFCDEKENLYILSYGPCRIKHKNAEILVDTLYPFRKDVTINVSVPKGEKADFSLFLKKPAWCDSINISIDEKMLTAQAENGFIKVGAPLYNNQKITVNMDMKPIVVETDDCDSSNKQPLSVLYGPLCFCLPVKENWINKGNGYAQTPLPEGWSWFEVEKSFEEKPLFSSLSRLDAHTWNFATTREALEKSLKVCEKGAKGYVWETPYVSILADGWQAPYLYNHYTPRTNDIYGKTVPITFERTVELVPFGCTNLRISCFAKAGEQIK